MSQNKTNEELLEAFEKVKDNKTFTVTIESETVPDVVKFILRTNIKPGSTKFRIKYLFKLFKSMYKSDLKLTGFSSTLSNFIEIKKGAALLDKELFQGISPEKFFTEKNEFVLKKMPRLVVKHLNQFIELYHIKPGNYMIPAIYMKAIFSRWRKHKTNTAPGEKAYILLNRILPKKHNRYGIYYGIELNEESRKVIKEDEVQVYHEKQKRISKEAKKRKRREAKKEERQRKISSIKSAIELKESSGNK